jgi:leader peptidase (prepilin peptidase)/N-methyltransferase
VEVLVLSFSLNSFAAIQVTSGFIAVSFSLFSLYIIRRFLAQLTADDLYLHESPKPSDLKKLQLSAIAVTSVVWLSLLLSLASSLLNASTSISASFWHASMISIGLSLLVSDIKSGLLPTLLLYVYIAVALISGCLRPGLSWLQMLLGAILLPLALYLFAFGFSKLRGVQSLGAGDVYILVAFGAAYGLVGASLIFATAIFAMFPIAVWSLAFSQPLRKVPFVPALVGGLICYDLGNAYYQALINWYLLLF